MTHNDRSWAGTLGAAERPAATLLTLLWGTSALLIVAHLSSTVLGLPSGYTWNLGVDRGYGELFGYLLTLWSGFLLVRLALRERATVLAVWAVACGYLVTDDWFQLHEAFGTWFEREFAGLGALSNHLGELVFLGTVGAVLLALVVLTHRRAPLVAREVSAVLVLLFSLFVLCSMVVDTLHAPFIGQGGPGRVALTTIEDGGEIVVLSAITTFLFAVDSTGHRPALHGRYARLLGVARASAAPVVGEPGSVPT